MYKHGLVVNNIEDSFSDNKCMPTRMRTPWGGDDEHSLTVVTQQNQSPTQVSINYYFTEQY